VPRRQKTVDVLVLKWRILIDSLVLYFVLLYDQKQYKIRYLYIIVICYLLLHKRSQKLQSVRKTWVPKIQNRGRNLLAGVDFGSVWGGLYLPSPRKSESLRTPKTSSRYN